MKDNRCQNKWTYRGPIGEENNSPSKTEPSNDLSLSEQVARAKAGILVKEYERLYDDSTMPRIGHLQPTERVLLGRQMADELKAKYKEYEAQAKAAQKEIDDAAKKKEQGNEPEQE